MFFCSEIPLADVAQQSRPRHTDQPFLVKVKCLQLQPSYRYHTKDNLISPTTAFFEIPKGREKGTVYANQQRLRSTFVAFPEHF